MIKLANYNEFINCRPLEKYKDDVPGEILATFLNVKKPNWTYWFSFNDNASLSEGILKRKSYQHQKELAIQNKILGLRGRATGLIFLYSIERNT